MTTVLTVAQMEEQFPGEWVLIGDPETNNALTVQAGKVLYHSYDRDEVCRQVTALRPRCSAVLYAGGEPRKAPFRLHASRSWCSRG